MKFQDAIEYVLKNEGDYANDRADRGGETRWGISKRAHPDVDVGNLTREEAIEIYRKEYWEPNQELFEAWDVIGVSKIQWQRDYFKTRIFDSIINCGQKNTVLILQRALNATMTKSILEDGIFGKITRSTIISCVRAKQEWPTAIAFQCERAAYYRVLAARDPTQEMFLGGWLKRAYS